MAYTPTNIVTVARNDGTSHNYQFRVTITEGTTVTSNTRDVTFTLQYKNDTNNTWWSGVAETYQPKVALFVNGAKAEETQLRTNSNTFVATTTWTTIITKTVNVAYNPDGTYSGTCGVNTTAGGGTAGKNYGPKTSDNSTVWAFGTPDKGMSTITTSSYPFIIDKTAGSIGVNCFPTGTNTIEIKDSSGQYQINDWNHLINKPTIPTVNNGTLTIQKNGTTVKTFTANQSGSVTANITVPTKVADLSDAGSYATTSALAAKAPLASPALTGTPTAPTAAKGTNTTQVATTAFVSTAVANAIAGVTQISYSVVTTLPTTGAAGVIYLIAHSHGTQDAYDEYIWTGTAYEKIGNTDVDLSGYVKANQLVELTNTEITIIVDNAYSAVFTS